MPNLNDFQFLNQVNGTTTIVVPEGSPTVNLLEDININAYLVFKKEGEDGPEVKGGTLDALIIHATKVQKKTDGRCKFFSYIASFLSFFFFLYEFKA